MPGLVVLLVALLSAPHLLLAYEKECVVDAFYGTGPVTDDASSALLRSPMHRMIMQAVFSDWLKRYKVTLSSNEEYFAKLLRFAENDRFIGAVNGLGLSYKLGHNMWSDLSQDEWRQRVKLGMGVRHPSTDLMQTLAENSSSTDPAPPPSVDWQARGAVTPVKQQGHCGSCWSFSTTGALEGAHFVKYGTLKSYSEQNLVDCDDADNGCDGGMMANAMAWIMRNEGLCLERDYPYTSGETDAASSCNIGCTKDAESIPKQLVEVHKACDDCLLRAIAQQPVAVAIEADHREFQLYRSGVFTAKCGSSLDHGVLAVGYGTSADGLKYYKIKNSWGAEWGMDGYILLERGSEEDREKERGKCGILLGPPVYVVM